MGNEGRGVSRHSRARRGGFGVDGRPPLDDAATRCHHSRRRRYANVISGTSVLDRARSRAFQRLSGIILGTRYPSFVHPSGFEVRFSFSRERNASIGFSHTPCEVGDPCRGSRVLILVRFPPGWDRLDERASKFIDFVSPFLFQTKIFFTRWFIKQKVGLDLFLYNLQTCLVS